MSAARPSRLSRWLRLGDRVAATRGRLADRVAALDDKVARIGRDQDERLAAIGRQLERVLSELTTRADKASVRDLRRSLDDLQASLTQDERDRRVVQRLERLARDGRSIVVGPWTGEVGFELLYWAPFVRWFAARYAIGPERLVVVSRGGTASWYGDVAARYADVFSYASVDEFRAATAAATKQRQIAAFDARIVEQVSAAYGLEHPSMLHPGLMYRLFTPVWKDVAAMSRLDAYSEHARVRAAADPALADLPSEYVAARFYFNEGFPDTSANRAFVTSTLETIAARTPVVLLGTPFAVDDHRDVTGGGSRVHRVDDRHMVPERNLAVQTAVIARARAFVGTYGGYAYLAPLCGVPSLAFYSRPIFKVHHLHAAQHIFEQLGTERLVALDVAAVPLVRLALHGALVTT